ncbi:hypothetical protein ACFS3C_20990 [Azotobacter vinelandii]
MAIRLHQLRGIDIGQLNLYALFAFAQAGQAVAILYADDLAGHFGG